MLKANFLFLITIFSIDAYCEQWNLKTPEGQRGYLSEYQYLNNKKNAEEFSLAFVKLVKSSEKLKKDINFEIKNGLSPDYFKQNKMQIYKGGLKTKIPLDSETIKNRNEYISDAVSLTSANILGPMGKFSSPILRNLIKTTLDKQIPEGFTLNYSDIKSSISQYLRSTDPLDKELGFTLQKKFNELFKIPDQDSELINNLIIQKAQLDQQAEQSRNAKLDTFLKESEKQLTSKLEQLKKIEEELEKRTEKQSKDIELQKKFQRQISDVRGATDIMAFTIENLGGDPKTAEGIRRVSGAITGLMETQNAYSKLNTIKELGLAASYLNAFTAISSLSTLGNPSSESVIIGMLNQLSDQIKNLHNTMIEGFKKIDTQLVENFNKVYDELTLIKKDQDWTIDLINSINSQLQHELAVTQELILQGTHSSYFKWMDMCFNSRFGKREKIPLMDAKLFDECLVEFKSWADSEGGWTQSQLNYDIFSNIDLQIGDLNFPYSRNLPIIFNYSSQFSDKQATLPNTLVPFPQLKDQVDNIIGLIYLYPDFAKSSIKTKSALDLIANKTKDYIKIYDRLLFTGSPNKDFKLDLLKVNQILNQYRNKIFRLIDEVFKSSMENINGKNEFHPAAGIDQPFRSKNPNFTALPLDEDIKLCNSKLDEISLTSTEALSNNTKTKKIKFNPYYGISKTLYLNNSHKLSSIFKKNFDIWESQLVNGHIAFPGIKPTKDFQKLIPNSFLWAQQENLGKISACVQNFHITDIKDFRIYRQKDMSYKLLFNLKIRFFYTHSDRSNTRVELNSYTYKGKIKVIREKILPVSFLTHAHGLSGLLWNGGDISLNSVNYGVTCTKPNNTYCYQKIPGVKGSFHRLSNSSDPVNKKLNANYNQVIKKIENSFKHYKAKFANSFDDLKKNERLHRSTVDHANLADEDLKYLKAI
ncbi:MAG: hypothetical protein KDD45_03295, partial [Bdellovibrionales bacterium]|nr:hypothetical protein [Bdellovibrionales bacterium]